MTGAPIPEAVPCPCGAQKPATLWRKYSASMLQSLRCPRCKRTSTAAALIGDIIRNWNCDNLTTKKEAR